MKWHGGGVDRIGWIGIEIGMLMVMIKWDGNRQLCMNRITVEEEEEQEDGNWKVLLQNGDEWED